MMMFDLIFYVVSALLIVSALMVVLSQQPVRSVLNLIACFCLAAVLWMLLQAEFLSLVLIFVYVGAVMTLFLFIVMMLHHKWVAEQSKSIRYVPWVIVGITLLTVLLIKVLGLKPTTIVVPALPADYSDVKAIGELLYTQYVLPCETTSLILLASIIAAVGLVFRGGRPDTKRQKARRQVEASKQERLTLIKDLK